MNDNLRQIRMDALSAKILHQRRKSKFELLNTTTSILTIIVPIIFIIAQYISKGTESENIVNNVSFSLALLLISVSILSLIFKITDNIAVHKAGINNNIQVANECLHLTNASEEDLKWFSKYVSVFDKQDADIFADVSVEEKKDIYREALKEFNPADPNITCPICNSSPYNYVKGDCQLCGNTKTIN